VSKFVIQAGDLELPLTPYAGTSGWSGSNASKDRAISEDANGTTSHRQNTALNHLFDSGYIGLTWKELAELEGWHHGQASGVLSVLNHAGFIVRLSVRRNRCSIYVMPKYIADREIAETKTKTCKNCGCEL
jgi:hypothetical protein